MTLDGELHTSTEEAIQSWPKLNLTKMDNPTAQKDHNINPNIRSLNSQNPKDGSRIPTQKLDLNPVDNDKSILVIQEIRLQEQGYGYEEGHIQDMVMEEKREVSIDSLSKDDPIRAPVETPLQMNLGGEGK
ncbi:hypothetical protein HAX54_018206, partial [Datura stramonium]|nr:hypothetical protein [Datura stramonium]